MFTRSLVLLTMFLSTPALAETELTDQTTGAVYILGEAAEGKVTLTSKADGEMDAFVLSEETCYAEHPIYGLGAWQGLEGRWQIMVQGSKIVSFDGEAPFETPVCITR